MSAKDDLGEFYVDSCEIKKKSTTNKFGEITFSAAVSYDECFVNQEIKEIQLPTGENYISNLQIHFDGNPDIDIGDVVTYNSEDMIIKYVRPIKEFGIAYSTIIYT